MTARERCSASATPLRSGLSSTTSAVSMATSVPPPIASPTSACRVVVVKGQHLYYRDIDIDIYIYTYTYILYVCMYIYIIYIHMHIYIYIRPTTAWREGGSICMIEIEIEIQYRYTPIYI